MGRSKRRHVLSLSLILLALSIIIPNCPGRKVGLGKAHQSYKKVHSFEKRNLVVTGFNFRPKCFCERSLLSMQKSGLFKNSCKTLISQQLSD
jgi:hypothetical protein